MQLHLHHLTGCSPSPLALYLKALGILRIVAEQADSQVRGWWQDEHFCLLTKLDRKELESFFLEKYSPTPFLSPWNKGCGFFKVNDPGLVPVENSTASRFATFRQGIAESRSLLDEISKADGAFRAIKDRTKTTKAFQNDEQRKLLKASWAYQTTVQTLQEELKNEDITQEQAEATNVELATLEYLISDGEKPTKSEATRLKNSDGYKRLCRVADKAFKTRKASLIPDCRREWRGLHAEWMASGVVLNEKGEAKFPSLLGTGGNDGNFDFTNNAMQRLGDLFDLSSEDGLANAATAELLCHCLWSEPSANLSADKIGQFLPGSGGGANSSTGADGDPLINAWDFILMLEGSIPFSARATRRLDPIAATKASAPFVVHAHAAGHASPGEEKDARGEQWMPVWSKPATYGDIKALLGDARLQLGRQTVNRPVDAARAISRLGVARGIESFTRFGFLERNGQSTLAVPLGRIRVRENPRSHLIDDISGWMNRLQRIARDSHAPARLVHAERRLADAVFAVLTHDYSFLRWQSVLETAVDIEAIQSTGTAIEAGPIPMLKAAWVSAVHDNSPEFRLALAIGSAAGGFTREQKPFDSIRHNWLPLERNARSFHVSDKRLVNDPRVVATGRDPIADCGAIVQRRLIDAEGASQRTFPLKCALGCGTRLPDLAQLIDGHIDLERVLKLSRALMAIDWHNWSSSYRDILPKSPPPNKYDDHPDEVWLALRLTCLPWPVADGLDIRAESSIVRRLLSGDGSTAVRIAVRRLEASGLRIPFQAAIADSDMARLWAAALAFPISRFSARRAVNILVPNHFGESHA